MILTVDNRSEVKNIEFFNSFTLNLRYDSVASAFSFSFYFDPNNSDHKFIASVANYSLVRLYHNGKLLLTGFILNNTFKDAAKNELASISGYSVPGVLEDCAIPPSAYPLQSDGLCLREIAEKFLLPFQIKIDIDPSVRDLMEIPIETTTAEPTARVKDYLGSLASQKNIILSHTPKGHLLFTKAKADDKPIYHFEENPPAFEYDFIFPGQEMHSQITVIKQADEEGGNAGEYTIYNKYVPKSTTAFRPEVIIQTEGDDISTKQCAENALAAEIAKIKLDISIANWDVSNDVVTPNTNITVKNPRVRIPNKTKFFIRETTLTGNNKEMSAKLVCALPEAFTSNFTDKTIFE